MSRSLSGDDAVVGYHVDGDELIFVRNTICFCIIRSCATHPRSPRWQHETDRKGRAKFVPLKSVQYPLVHRVQHRNETPQPAPVKLQFTSASWVRKMWRTRRPVGIVTRRRPARARLPHGFHLVINLPYSRPYYSPCPLLWSVFGAPLGPAGRKDVWNGHAFLDGNGHGLHRFYAEAHPALRCTSWLNALALQSLRMLDQEVHHSLAHARSRSLPCRQIRIHLLCCKAVGFDDRSRVGFRHQLVVGSTFVLVSTFISIATLAPVIVI